MAAIRSTSKKLFGGRRISMTATIAVELDVDIG